MDLFILLRANIKKKPGTFISIVILTMIAVTATAAILAVRDNSSRAITAAFDEEDLGDISVLIKSKLLTEALRSEVENDPLVGRVRYYDALVADSAFTENGGSTNNNWFMMKARGGIKLFNENADGFEPWRTLENGEIYLPLSQKSVLSCAVGDTINVKMAGSVCEFTIAGFVQEPCQGSSTMGWKQVFISDEDFDRLQTSCASLSDTDITSQITVMMIYKSESCTLSDAKFQRQLNLDTRIIANAIGSLTKTQSIYYTGMTFEIISGILLAFMGFLFVIVLIVISHSISTEIDLDDVKLGILKAQGFTGNRIRVLFAAQYLLAELTGIVLGIIAALPLERVLSSMMTEISGILPDTGLSFGKSLLLIVMMLLLSAGIIFIKTKKISRISPVRAISGNREPIYFDSRLHTPITKKALSASLALRQLSSAKRMYISSVIIVAILTFFMLSVNLLGNLLTSRTTLTAMGLDIADVDVDCKKIVFEEHLAEIEALVECYSGIENKYYMNGGYMSVNGENIRYTCYVYPECMTERLLKGRAPIYDNEIVITTMVADTLDIQPGDTVTVSNMDMDGTYIVSGIFQNMDEGGMIFALSFDGAKKLGIDSISYMGFVLADPSQNSAVADALNEQFGDILSAAPYSFEEEGLGEGISATLAAVQIVIYAFSVLFALTVVCMVCSKAFIGERTDIGICKAVGFTVNALRLQFAVRFLIVALIGAALGTALAAAFSAKLLGSILSIMGVSRLDLPFTAQSALLPAAVVSICFFVFAYMSSGKIRHVQIRELVTE